MRKWILTTLSILATASCALSSCSKEPTPNGFIDKTGKLVIDLSTLNPKPIAAGDFGEGEGLAVVQMPNGFGAIDKNGAIVFTKPFRHLNQYSEDKAAFAEGTSAADEKWGYVDKKGAVVIKPVYTAAAKFCEGVAAVRLSSGQWTYIDETGKQAIRQTYDQAEPFSEGIAAVKLKGRMGAMNRLGAMIVPNQYDVVYACNDGTIVAAQGTGLSGENPDQQLDYYNKVGKRQFSKEIKGITLQNLRPSMWVLIDKKADKDSAAQKIDERPLSTFVTPGFSETKSISQAGTKFCIDQQFNARAFKGGYDYIYPVSDGFMVVYSDAQGGKKDYRGGVPEDASGIWNSTAFRFFDAAPFSDGMGLVEETKGGPYGYVDKSGNYALKPIYDHARPFHDDLALVGELAAHPL